jgi:hypothetical protein
MFSTAPSVTRSVERIEQLVDIGDGVLEQVADTAPSCLEEFDYLPRFEVAREEQDSQGQVKPSSLGSGHGRPFGRRASWTGSA